MALPEHPALKGIESSHRSNPARSGAPRPQPSRPRTTSPNCPEFGCVYVCSCVRVYACVGGMRAAGFVSLRPASFHGSHTQGRPPRLVARRGPP